MMWLEYEMHMHFVKRFHFYEHNSRPCEMGYHEIFVMKVSVQISQSPVCNVGSRYIRMFLSSQCLIRSMKKVLFL